jgi:hypothetical protein
VLEVDRPIPAMLEPMNNRGGVDPQDNRMGVPAMPRHDGYKHGMVSGATTTKLEIAQYPYRAGRPNRQIRHLIMSFKS